VSSIAVVVSIAPTSSLILLDAVETECARPLKVVASLAAVLLIVDFVVFLEPLETFLQEHAQCVLQDLAAPLTKLLLVIVALLIPSMQEETMLALLAQITT